MTYNNIDAARAEAKSTNKPLFVTFRCIPCHFCKGVDLSQFQFDYDLNLAAMFVNADDTVYARYGTQSAAGAIAYNSITSLEKTMRCVLALHEDYPNNKNGLAGELVKLKPYKAALEIPGMKHRTKRNYEGGEKLPLTMLRNGKRIQFDWLLNDGD